MQAIPHIWTTQIRDDKAEDVVAFRGEDMALATMFADKKIALPLPADAEVKLFIQTLGMTGFWGYEGGVDSEGRATATFTPKMDNGADRYIFFLGVKHNGKRLYRANGRIEMRGSPGPVPNQIPFPPQVIDLEEVQILHPEAAPWLMKSPAFDDGIDNFLSQFPAGEVRSLQKTNQAVDALAALLQLLRSSNEIPKG